MFDAINALQLKNEELAVRRAQEPRGAALFGQLQRQDHGAVFGDVIRPFADIFGLLLQNLIVLIAKHHANAGRSGIAARAAVGIGVEQQENYYLRLSTLDLGDNLICKFVKLV